MKLQTCDILLFRNKKFFLANLETWGLGFFTGDPAKYMHSEIMISDSEYLGAGKWVDINPIIKLRKKHYTHIKVFRRKNLTEEQKVAIVADLKSRVDEPYNSFRMLLHVFNTLFNTTWFTDHIFTTKVRNVCSSLIAWAWQKNTGDIFDGRKWVSVGPDELDDESRENFAKWDIAFEGPKAEFLKEVGL